jgi:chemotaxis protein histidine kinase CheA
VLSDNDLSAAMVDLSVDAQEDQEDRTVQWLLEQDYADPAEKLFTVSEQDAVVNAGLTEYEAEIANRPMFGGEGSSDDVSCFVSEEIVMSETGAANIFCGSESDQSAAHSGAVIIASGFSMAVDRSGVAGAGKASAKDYVEEGFDILGLDEDDDIGGRHVVMQKIPLKIRNKPLHAVGASKASQENIERLEAPVSLDEVQLAQTYPEALGPKVPELENSVSEFSLELPEETSFELSSELTLELAEVELLDQESELEIQDLLTLDILEDDSEISAAAFDGFLSDVAAPLLNPQYSVSETLEVDVNIVELEPASDLESLTDLQINLGAELDAGDASHEEAGLARVDDSSNFLSAQAQNLIVPDAAEIEEPLDMAIVDDSTQCATEAETLAGSELETAIELVEGTAADLDADIDLLAAAESSVKLPDDDMDSVVAEEVAEVAAEVSIPIISSGGFLSVEHNPVSLEEAVEVSETNASPDSASEEFGVLDYLAANEPPVDDDEFDQYLLAGEHLEDPDVSLDGLVVDGLVVDGTGGIASVDPQLETTIDYHEDFKAQESFNNDFVSAITSVIAQVMEELTVCVEKRLNNLSVAPQSVLVEVMLGTDDDSIKQCQDESYLPILRVATTKLDALSSLGQTEIDAIYVRLSNVYDNSDWNQLFSEGFVAKSNVTEKESILITPSVSDEDDFLGDGLSFTDSVAASEDLASGKLPEVAQELTAESIFDEEILAEGCLEEFTSPFDIDDELENITAQLLDYTKEDGLADPVKSSSTANFANLDYLDDMVFGEDIFSADLTDEFTPISADSGIDVEALIHSLADVETDIGEICGVSVDQFTNTDAANSPDTLAAALPEQSGAVATAIDDDRGLSWCVPADVKFSYTNQPSTEIFSEFLDAFIEEGASELEKLEDALGDWEKDISNETAYVPIPRILHTLKGIAKGVGLQRYGTLIHNFETLLDALERPDVGQRAAYFRMVNGWLDASAKGFEHIEKERTDIASELPTHSSAPVLDKVKAVAAEIEPVLPVSVQALPDEPVAAPEFSAMDAKSKDKQLADEGAKVLAAQQTIRMTPEALDRLLSLTNEAQQLGVRSSQATVRSKRSAAELLSRLSSVRAHVSKIAERTLLNVTAKGGQSSSTMDALEMDQYSELQEAANFLREGVEDLDDLIHLSSRQNTVAEALLKQQASIISSLGSSIQSARVIPVSRLMPGLRRIVRTVSADLGKSVSFRVLNEVGTLDRDNHARCQIILEHMTRNALDHGIETPDVRAAAGKNTTGSITIEASKLGSDYIVTLSDDGKGIDPDFMRDMAYEKGLDIDVDKLSDEEAIRLIFHKGFSTATVVSEISGRGVGMDIVLSELHHIGGDIEIESAVGVGTTFKVRIPSNVTVNGALLVAAGEVSYAIPLDGLIAVEHVPVDVFYDAIRNDTQLSIFGMDCDPAYLATICHGDSLPDRSSWNATVPVIIAGSEKRYMAIAIDDVTQALELVIRSLGAQFSMIPGLAGGATTADGKSIVALDLNALVESASSDTLSSVSLRTEREERMLVLVVDDSRTQRMVATSQFDNLGVETVTAENGLVAIDLLNTTHRLPDVILLDIEMPVKDGIQTLREIRKSTRYADLPVIMVTSRTGAKHRALAEEAGCNGYMGKPFNFPKLVEQIADLTNHKFQLS